MRLLLAAFRDAAHASSAGLFLYDPEAQLLRTRWRDPNQPRHPLVHPISTGCALTLALERQETVRAGVGRRDEGSTCDVCSKLFGGVAVAAVPIAIGESQRAVVAAFASAGGQPGNGIILAGSIARHLGAFLTSCQAAERAEARAAWLAAVDRAARRLTSVLDVELLYPRILSEMISVVPGQAATLYVFDHQARRLRIAAVQGLSADQRCWLEETAAERMPGAVFRSGQPGGFRDTWRELRGDPVSRRLARLTGVRSALFVPIGFDGESMGVIGLGRARTAAFREEDYEAARLLAQHAGVALTNARLHHRVSVRLQSKLRDLGNLGRIGQTMGASLQVPVVLQSIVQGAADAFESSGISIVLFDQERNDMFVAAVAGTRPPQIGERIPIDGSACGLIIRRRETLFVQSMRDVDTAPLRSRFERYGVKSWIGVPLMVQGKAIGSLNVVSRLGPWFDTVDVELLQALAAQAAVAISHADLYESIARQKANLEAIVESLHEGLLLAGSDGSVVYASRRLSDLLGFEIPSPELPTIDRIWDEVVVRCVAPSDTRSRLKALDFRLSEAVALGFAQPPPRDLEVRGFRVDGAQGDLLGRGYLVRDITQQAELERLKVNMLSAVSHELRSPLAAIKGFATSLLRTDVMWDRASRRDFIEQIDHEADRLGALVRNLLDMSQLASGTLRLDRHWCNLSDLVVDVVERMAPLLAHHHVDLVLGDGMVLALVDRLYLERVIWNLVENAAKYSPHGSTITVCLAWKGREIILTVRDEGVGVKPEERERIFDRFYRGAGVRSPGIGLGLSICRGIVEAHGGTIAVEGRPGCGSTFVVILPGRTDQVTTPAVSPWSF